jgi:hypothetical protein
MKINFPSHLTDTALMAAVRRLAAGEREATVQLITHLAELDRRRLYLPAGYSSLYAYCRSEPRLSEPEAYMRMKAAREVRRFPRILVMLAEGSVNLTTLRLLIPHLKSFNHQALLDAAAGKSKREVQELLARLFPQADVPASVRKLPAPSRTGEVVVPSTLTQLNDAVGLASARPPAPAKLPASLATCEPVVSMVPTVTERPLAAQPPVSSNRPLVTPLALDRYQITFTASGETREKLELARDLLRHAIPDGDPAAIMDRALTALLHEVARTKFADTRKPRPGRGTLKRSRYIPAKVKRQVWVRDLGRCAFVAADSRRCGERAFVEFHHHDEPYGVGGPPTMKNIQLRCRAHNRYEADVYYAGKPNVTVVKEASASYGPAATGTTVSGPSCVVNTQVCRSPAIDRHQRTRHRLSRWARCSTHRHPVRNAGLVMAALTPAIRTT